MMPALLRDSTNDARCLCWFFADSVNDRFIRSDLHHHDQKTQNLVVQSPSCSFTLPIVPTLRNKIGLAAVSFHHPHA